MLNREELEGLLLSMNMSMAPNPAAEGVPTTDENTLLEQTVRPVQPVVPMQEDTLIDADVNAPIADNQSEEAVITSF